MTVVLRLKFINLILNLDMYKTESTLSKDVDKWKHVKSGHCFMESGHTADAQNTYVYYEL